MVLPDGYCFGIINKQIRFAIKVCNEECEKDVNGKEGVDNVVKNGQCVLLVSQECELKGRYPGRVNNQDNQKYFPSPEMKINK